MDDKIKQTEDTVSSNTEVVNDEQSLDVVEPGTSEVLATTNDTTTTEDVISAKGSSKQNTRNAIKKINESCKDSHTMRCEKLAKKYSKVYPNEQVFHITTDYQVFLSASKSHALNHQRTLKNGEITTIKIK